MARNNDHDRVRNKKVTARKYPEIFIDEENDFASIKIAAGIEAKSFLKDGFVFCENAEGEIIEIQVLNLSQIKTKSRSA
jgi:hypothetical protein